MATLVCKPNVRFRTFTPALMRILRGVYTVAQTITDVPEIVITSVNDGEHMGMSRHYTDEAIDIRTKHFASEIAKLRFAALLRAELGPKFSVLYEYPAGENQHLHIQPKKGTAYTGPA